MRVLISLALLGAMSTTAFGKPNPIFGRGLIPRESAIAEGLVDSLTSSFKQVGNCMTKTPTDKMSMSALLQSEEATAENVFLNGAKDILRRFLTCLDMINTNPNDGNAGKSDEQTLREMIEKELKGQLKENQAVEMDSEEIADEQFLGTLLGHALVGKLLKSG